MSPPTEEPDGSDVRMKIVGRRRWGRGLVASAPLLRLNLELRGDKPFLPKGVHRFHSFEDSEEWTLRMLTETRNPALRS